MFWPLNRAPAPPPVAWQWPQRNQILCGISCDLEVAFIQFQLHCSASTWSKLPNYKELVTMLISKWNSFWNHPRHRTKKKTSTYDSSHHSGWLPSEFEGALWLFSKYKSHVPPPNPPAKLGFQTKVIWVNPLSIATLPIREYTPCSVVLFMHDERWPWTCFEAVWLMFISSFQIAIDNSMRYVSRYITMNICLKSWTRFHTQLWHTTWNTTFY